MKLIKKFFLLATAINLTSAIKPSNYIEKPKVPDKFPPKYEFNYFVTNHNDHAAQGHKEIRNGDHTRGNYFVNLPKGESKTTVNYIADEWGFFPVTRYSSQGPHHRASGHFALGQHAVERLNETNLNTHEVLVNQLSDYQQAPLQQQAQATFPAPQVVVNPMASHQLPLQIIDNKQPLNNVYTQNPPPQNHHQQQIVFQSPGSFYHQQIPLLRNQEKHPNPLIFQRAQQMPLIYQYAQQHAPPQLNYYYQQQQPQEVIYHQQPIASMASSQQNPHEQPQQQQQQQQYVFVEQSSQAASRDHIASNNGNSIIANSLHVPTQQFTDLQEENLPPQVDDGVNGNLINFQPEAVNNVATDNQKQVEMENDFTSDEELKRGEEKHFQSPIVVEEKQIAFLSSNQSDQTVVVQPHHQNSLIFQSYQPTPQKQINIQILNSGKHDDQSFRETSVTPKITNAHTNSNNYQYLVSDDQDFLDSTPSTANEAPSRQFLKKFKNFRTYEESTTATSHTFSTSTSQSVTKINKNSECCKDNVKTDCCNKNSQEIVLEITQRPPLNTAVRLSNEKHDNCADEVIGKPVSFQNVQLVQEPVSKVPVYGEKIIVSSTPATTVVVEKPIFIEKPQRTELVEKPIFIEKQHHTEVIHHRQQPIFIEKPVIKEVQVPVEKTVYIKTPAQFIDRPVYVSTPTQTKVVEKIVHHPVEVEKVVEKIVDRPFYIKSPPETKVIHQQVIVEKPVIKEVQVPVEKTVYVQSPPETKIVHQPVIQTVEKPVYIEKIVQQPYEVEKVVEKFIDRPVIQTVERIVDRPVTVEKFIDRPYPVPYAVPYEKHIYRDHKPDFHVYAKTIPHKHRLFDFEGLFGFLSKKKEVKHIFVPSSQQHQLKQLNQHQLIKSTLTTIEPAKESPIFDFSRYSTHLNPIKPVYGVPSTPLAPVNAGYSYPNPYAGNYAYDQLKTGGAGVATIPSSWLENFEVQQAQSSIQNAQVVSGNRDKYVGMPPLSDDYWAVNGVSTNEGVKFRRNVENGRSFRVEYGGFHPKMSPSVEIDENGKPLKKAEN